MLAQANILYMNMNIQKLKFVSFHFSLSIKLYLTFAYNTKEIFQLMSKIFNVINVHQFQTIFCLLLTDRNQAFVALTVEFVWFRQSLLLTTINQI